MSQKKETTILVLSLLLTLGLVGGGFWLFKDQILPPNQSGGNFDQSIADRISFGEKILIPGVSRVNDEVVQAFANQNYSQAIASLESSLQQHRNDPIALIYLNNARIGSGRSYTIVASVPLGTNPNSSLEILWGIAHAQNAVNNSGGINGIPLKVGIANDDDNPQIAEKIAANLVNNSDILGVIGHNASDTTLATGKIYSVFMFVNIVAIQLIEMLQPLK
jgi:branched-chain amino acid transport system substrate-binding protein